jgi:hypothetical protein
MKCLFLLAIALPMLMFTNPDRQDYIRWLNRQVSAQVKAEVCDSARAIAPIPYQPNAIFCHFGINVLQATRLSHLFLDISTEHQNWLFFSTYQTAIAGYEVRAIGIFNQFVVYDF